MACISSLFNSCRKENYSEFLRSEKSRLSSANKNYTTVYTIHTEKGSWLDIYRDASGFINIYKKKLNQADLGHIKNIEIKNTKGSTCKLSLFNIEKLDHVRTSIRGNESITIFQNKIILFDEKESTTTPAGSIYTLKTESNAVELKYQLVRKLGGPLCCTPNDGLPYIRYKGVTLHQHVIFSNNEFDKWPINWASEKILIKNRCGEFQLGKDEIINKANRLLASNLCDDVKSISVNGIYLYNTLTPAQIVKRQKRDIINNPFICNTNATEELIYDINTEAYASVNPVGSGIFSVRRLLNGQIVIYQENAEGPGNPVVNYEISANNYKAGPAQTPFLFNEATFSLRQDEQRDTRLNGLITVKRNGIVLFNELDEILKTIPSFCMADLCPKAQSSTNSQHHIVPRGIGQAFYPLPSDGSPLVLRVKFINGCPSDFRDFIRSTASEWESHAHVRFDFLEDQSTAFAHIRIDIGTGLPNDSPETYSAIGFSAMAIPLDQPTMRLPLSIYRAFQNGIRTEAFVTRSILHEFGHALGLEHEHQNPHAQIHWNKSIVYSSFTPSGLSPENIDRQLFEVLDGPTISNSGQYDPHSIMNYAFPRSFIIGASACPPSSEENISTLSDGDKAFITSKYPKPEAQPNPPNQAPTPPNNQKRPASDDEPQQPPRKKKPEYSNTTNEPPDPARPHL